MGSSDKSSPSTSVQGREAITRDSRRPGIPRIERHRSDPIKNGARTKIFSEKFGPPGPILTGKMVRPENFGPI